MKFKSDIDKFAKKSEKKVTKVLQAGTLEIFSELIRVSPVGNASLWAKPPRTTDYIGGRFRNNWQTSIGAPSSGFNDSPDSNGALSKAMAMSVIPRIDFNDTVWIVNNLPYAIALENGSSTQAPRGIVKLTVKRWNRAVNAAAKKEAKT